MSVSDHPVCDAPDNQLRFAFADAWDEGAKLMEDARKWAAIHYFEWIYFKDCARRATAAKGYARANFCIEAMREKFLCKVPNAYAPCFARIAMEESPHDIKFKCGRSKTDGFTTAVLN